MKKISASFLFLLICLVLLSAAPEERSMNVLVYPFKNAGSPKFSWISAGMTDTVIADLQRLKSVNVFSEEDRKKAFDEIALGMSGVVKEEDVVKAGDIMGADVIFTGTYIVVEKKIRVVSKLMDVETTRMSRSRKLDGTMEGIFELQDRIVAALMEDAEEVHIEGKEIPKFTKQEKYDVKKGYTPSSAAFELFSRALEKIERSPNEALYLAKKAVHLDPNYHNALTLIGGIYSTIGDGSNADLYYAKAKRALEESGMGESADYAYLLQSMAVTSWNKGDNHDSIEYNMEAKRIWESLGKKESPVYAGMMVVLGAAYRNLGDQQKGLLYTAQAKDTLERAGLRKTSGYGWAVINLGVIYQVLKDYEKAVSLFRESKKTWEELGMNRSMGYAFAVSQIGSAYFSKGDYDSALSHLKEGMALSDKMGYNKSIQYGAYAWTAANSCWMMGRYCEGVPYMKKAVDAYISVGHADAPKAQKALQDFTGACGK